MSDRQHDSELRARFDAQRRAEAGEAPSFDAMIAGARFEAADVPGTARGRRVRLRRLVYAGGLAAAAAVAAVLVIPGSRAGEDAFEEAVRVFQTDPALGAWRSPTAGLLEVPGRQLMSTVPSVGTER
jgi:hypothetical protein